MLEGFERDLLHAAEQRREVRVAGKVETQREGVHEEADQAFEFGTGAACDAGAGDQVVLAGVAVQERAPACKKGHEEGHGFALAQAAELFGQYGAQPAADLFAAKSLGCGARAIRWEFE